jgi:hypothetical protein
VVTTTAGARPRASRAKPAAPAVATPAPAAAAPAEPVLTVWIDPDTQEMGLDPGPGRVPLGLGLTQLNALNTSMDGLTPVTKDGVTRIDFQGRFQPVWMLVIDRAGQPRPVCLTSLPPAVAAAADALRKEAGHDR